MVRHFYFTCSFFFLFVFSEFFFSWIREFGVYSPIFSRWRPFSRPCWAVFPLSPVRSRGGDGQRCFTCNSSLSSTPLCYRCGDEQGHLVCLPSSPACFPLPSIRPVLSSGRMSHQERRASGAVSLHFASLPPCQLPAPSTFYSSGVVSDVCFARSEGHWVR